MALEEARKKGVKVTVILLLETIGSVRKLIELLVHK
jgi:hypothetical protein